MYKLIIDNGETLILTSPKPFTRNLLHFLSIEFEGSYYDLEIGSTVEIEGNILTADEVDDIEELQGGI